MFIYKKTIVYKKRSFKVKPYVKSSVCFVDGKGLRDGITIIQTHHTKYEYGIAEVRKNPELAKENTVDLCFYHHRLGNAIRVVKEFLAKDSEGTEKLLEVHGLKVAPSEVKGMLDLTYHMRYGGNEK